MLWRGRDMLRRQPVAALPFFHQSAQLNCADALGELALCHLFPHRGVGHGDRDHGLGFRLARKGHEAGSWVATAALYVGS